MKYCNGKNLKNLIDKKIENEEKFTFDEIIEFI